MSHFWGKLPTMHDHVFLSLIYIPLRKLVMPYDNDPQNEKSHESWIPFRDWKLLSKKIHLRVFFFKSSFFFFGLNSTFSHADETPKHRLQLRENCSKISLMAFKESHRKTESRLSAFPTWASPEARVAIFVLRFAMIALLF